MGAYTSDNILREKWSGRQTAEDYQWKTLIRKMLTNWPLTDKMIDNNIIILIKILQIRQYFPP